MERITKWDQGVPTYDGRFKGEPTDDMHPAWKAVYRHWRPIDISLEVLRRLAEYEDTGLTPKEIAALKKMTDEHLIELKRAKIDNKLVVLPVAINGALYLPAKSEYGPTAMRGIIQDVFIHASRHAKRPHITLGITVVKAEKKVYNIN